MNINWFPGHMKKTMDKLKENIRLVDVVFEMIDARIPQSSSNPILRELTNGKELIYLINKTDLADPEKTALWRASFDANDVSYSEINAKSKASLNQLMRFTMDAIQKKRAPKKEKGVRMVTVRAMVIGVPNIGKSTLINTIHGSTRAQVGNRPGVTKRDAWIKVSNELMLLDTPGVLWPKFESELQGRKLAYTGAIKDEILDTQDLAFYFLEDMRSLYPERFEHRYGVDMNMTSLDIMEQIAKKSGKLVRGGDVDYEAVSRIILDDFRSGRLGRMTLEVPDEHVG